MNRKVKYSYSMKIMIPPFFVMGSKQKNPNMHTAIKVAEVWGRSRGIFANVALIMFWASRI